MNQHLDRIVFNTVRGCVMAVAQTAAAQGKAGERRNTATSAAPAVRQPDGFMTAGTTADFTLNLAC